jgi:SAM-dependent methyltransferase
MSSPSEPEQLEGVAALYAGSLAEHGTASQGVGWPDEAGQRLRFDRLFEVVEPGVRAVTVNDLGCGYGAMLDYLDERLGPELASYRGYDISAEMLVAARERVRDPRAEFVQAARPDGEADYSFAGGTFNVKLDATDAAWGAYVADSVRGLAAASRRGFAFNLLTNEVDWREPQLFYADPQPFLELCRELGAEPRLLSGYGLYEWTIVARVRR